jgi:hypothetical protein
VETWVLPVDYTFKSSSASLSASEGDTPKQKAEAKKKAFKRAIEDAHRAILIVTREIDDIQ